MKIIHQRPPNYKELKEKFEFDDKITVFAYGDKLYNPSRLRIPIDVMVHEKVHQRQQEEIGVEVWWRKYLDDVEFRLSQEMEAYRTQYGFVRSKYGEREDYLGKLADVLCSPVYGNIINKEQALNGIRECLG